MTLPDVPLLNRENAILEFNRRVLAQAQRLDVPLLERLRYICIVSSNLDEFFEVRFADMLDAPRDGSGLVSPRDVERVGRAAHDLIDQQYAIFNDQVMPALREHNIQILNHADRTDEMRAWVGRFFEREVRPLLVPVGLDPALVLGTNKLSACFGTVVSTVRYQRALRFFPQFKENYRIHYNIALAHCQLKTRVAYEEALKCLVCPTIRAFLAGVTVTALTPNTVTAAVFEQLAVQLASENVAVIVTEPATFAVTTPAEETVALVASLVAQVTFVRVLTEPSE